MKKTIRIAVSLVLVLVLALSLAGCGGQNVPYASVLDNITKGMSGDMDALIAIFPPEYAAIFESMGMDMKDVVGNLAGASDLDGVTWKVTNEEALSKDTIDDLNEDRHSMQDYLDVDIKDITEGYSLEVVFSYNGDDQNSEMHVLCIGGKWYIDPDNFDI